MWQDSPGVFSQPLHKPDGVPVQRHAAAAAPLHRLTAPLRPRLCNLSDQLVFALSFITNIFYSPEAKRIGEVTSEAPGPHSASLHWVSLQILLHIIVLLQVRI